MRRTRFVMALLVIGIGIGTASHAQMALAAAIDDLRGIARVQ